MGQGQGKLGRQRNGAAPVWVRYAVKSTRRVWLAPAYVLHQYAYRDTSRIVEVFTGEYGRLTLFARGANGPKSALRGVLRPFQRMLVSWSGKGEACQLVMAEIDGVITNLSAERLMSGFYLNELLLKLTQRCDPHPEIFLSYASCVQALCSGEIEEPTLRCFEKRLLNDLGYGLDLARTGDGVPVDRAGDARRRIRPIRGRSAGRELRRHPHAARCQAHIARGHRRVPGRPLAEIP